jgi:dihydroxyacid dehydratase/phosphogluconate dehydratase
MIRTIEADFNAADEVGRFWVHNPPEGAERGEIVLLRDGDTEVQASLDFDQRRGIWVALPDMRTRRERRPQRSAPPVREAVAR